MRQPFETLALERTSDRGWLVKARTESIEACYLVDATGRRTRLGGRKQRVSAPVLALYAYWRETSLDSPETRVEAGESEWYWGAPLPDGSFNATVFVDAERCGGGREELYGRLLQRSVLLKGCRNGRRITAVKCCAAASYFDENPIADNLLKAGEASFSIDPLIVAGSPFGDGIGAARSAGIEYADAQARVRGAGGRILPRAPAGGGVAAQALGGPVLRGGCAAIRYSFLAEPRHRGTLDAASKG